MKNCKLVLKDSFRAHYKESINTLRGNAITTVTHNEPQSVTMRSIIIDYDDDGKETWNGSKTKNFYCFVHSYTYRLGQVVDCDSVWTKWRGNKTSNHHPHVVKESYCRESVNYSFPVSHWILCYVYIPQHVCLKLLLCVFRGLGSMDGMLSLDSKIWRKYLDL